MGRLAGVQRGMRWGRSIQIQEMWYPQEATRRQTLQRQGEWITTMCGQGLWRWVCDKWAAPCEKVPNGQAVVMVWHRLKKIEIKKSVPYQKKDGRGHDAAHVYMYIPNDLFHTWHAVLMILSRSREAGSPAILFHGNPQAGSLSRSEVTNLSRIYTWTKGTWEDLTLKYYRSWVTWHATILWDFSQT